MEHSLYGYLTRRSDEELQAIVQHCLRKEEPAYYFAYVRPIIVKIMEERERKGEMNLSADEAGS